MPEITKIVITGGPCSGKTTAMSRLMEEFTERGFRVLCAGRENAGGLDRPAAPSRDRQFH